MLALQFFVNKPPPPLRTQAPDTGLVSGETKRVNQSHVVRNFFLLKV